jgi:hypothetical protein
MDDQRPAWQVAAVEVLRQAADPLRTAQPALDVTAVDCRPRVPIAGRTSGAVSRHDVIPSRPPGKRD